MPSRKSQDLLGGSVYAIGVYLLLHAFISYFYLIKQGRVWILLHDGGRLMFAMELLAVAGIIASFVFLLKGNKGSITSLKGLRLALTWFILYELLEMFFIPTPQNVIFRIMMVIFLIILLYHLKKAIIKCHEEGIEEDHNSLLILLPEKVLLYGSLILLVSLGISFYSKGIKALPYLPDTIHLKPEEMTTCMANFIPLDGWQLDSTIIVNDVQEHIFTDSDSAKWYITSFPTIYNDRRNHNMLITITSPAFQDGKLVHRQLLDTLLTDDLILRSDSFEGYEKGDTAAFTFATLYSKKYLRNLIVARVSNDFSVNEDLMTLIGGVRFDLTGKKKSR